MKKMCLVALIAWMGRGAVGAQAPARDAGSAATEGTGSISGVVLVDAEGGGPIRLARVELMTGTDFHAQVVTTDERGRFAFTRLPAARYTLSAKKAGFIAANYGAKRLGGAGVPIMLGVGEQARADITLVKSAAISGTVRGPDGAPASGVRLELFQYDYTQNGDRSLQLRTFSNSQNGQLTTDDRGVYRIYGIRPGEYFLVAEPRAQMTGSATSSALLDWAQRLLTSPNLPPTSPPATSSHALAYVAYPGVSDLAQAAPITVTAGQELSGIDLLLNYVQTATVSGVISTPDGQVPSPAQLSLVQPGRPFGLGGAAGGFIRSDASGAWSTSGVLPGDYKLAARGAVRGTEGLADAQTGGASMPLWALLDVNVAGQDITGVDVKLAPGTTVSGRLAFAATTAAPPADLSKVTVSLNPMQTHQVTSMAPGAARANADGTFTIPGVGPGVYRLTANLMAAGVPANTWFVRSSVVGGVDVLDGMFEMRDQPVSGATITFTDHPAQLSGALLDTNDRPVPEYFVVVFPADRTFWAPQSRRVRSVRPGTTGRFTINNLPPGDYYVCALVDVETNRLWTPEYLEPLIPAGLKITLTEGEKKAQDLKVAAK